MSVPVEEEMVSQRARRHGSGGRTGQHYSATPNLRSYSTPPAGPVTITRADGTVETEPPKKAVRSVPQPQRKNKRGGARSKPKSPAMPTMKQLITVECPSCGRKAGEPCTLRQGHRARVAMYLAAAGKRSTPAKVVEAVQRGVQRQEEKRTARRPVSAEERAERAAQLEASRAANRRKAVQGKGNPYKNPNAVAVGPELWSKVGCPRCKAAPGKLCVQPLNGGVVKTSVPHRDRLQVVRRAWAQQAGT